MNYHQFLFEAAIDTWLNRNKNLLPQEQELAKGYFKDLQSKYTEHLDPTAKNLVVLSFEILKLLHNTIQIAIIKNLLPATTQWLTKQIINGKVFSLKNAEEDYIPPLKVYQNNKENLPKLNTVSDIKELNDILNEKLQSEQREIVPESDLGKIAEMGGWAMYMPHTTEASCELGKTGGKRDTTWCTTRTEGQNLYINYVAPKENNYTLFYVIKSGVNAEKQPFAKMSVGTMDDKILFDQGENNITVNANNENLTEEKFREVLGDETADFFLDKIREIIGQPSFKHPLISEMERLARDPIFLAKKLSQYGKKRIDLEAKEEFIEQLIDYDIKNPEIFKILFAEGTPEIRYKLSEDENLPPEILAIFAKESDPEIRMNIAKNPNTPPEALKFLSKDRNWSIRVAVAENPNSSGEVLLGLADGGNIYVETAIANNPSTPPELLKKLSRSDDYEIRSAIALNPNTSPKTLTRLAKDHELNVRQFVIKNRNAPSSALDILTEDWELEDDDVELIAKHQNTSPDTLKYLANSKNMAVRIAVAKNPNTPPEIAQKLKAELGLKESRKLKKISLSSIIFRN